MFISGNIELGVQVVDRHHDGSCEGSGRESQALFEEELPEVGEHGESFGYDIFEDEGAFALLAFKVALPDEFHDGCPDGRPADVEEFTEVFLGGDLRADGPFVVLDLSLQDLIEL